MRKLTQRGDTIVEVLIAIAVISSVLGMAFGTMNRNMLILRDNQERTEATKLAQGQIENLKAAWGNTVLKDQIEDKAGDGFCMSGQMPTDLTSPAPAAVTTDDDFANYPAACQNSYYNIGIRQLTDRIYKVYVRYDRLGTSGRSEIVMVYKLP